MSSFHVDYTKKKKKIKQNKIQRKPRSKSDAFTWNIEIFACNSPCCLYSSLKCNERLLLCYSELPLYKPRSRLLSATLPRGICIWYLHTLQNQSPCHYSHTQKAVRYFQSASPALMYSASSSAISVIFCTKKKPQSLCWEWGYWTCNMYDISWDSAGSEAFIRQCFSAWH